MRFFFTVFYVDPGYHQKSLRREVTELPIDTIPLTHPHSHALTVS